MSLNLKGWDLFTAQMEIRLKSFQDAPLRIAIVLRVLVILASMEAILIMYFTIKQWPQ